MKLTLKRIALQPTYTIGRLYIDGTYFCDTCEDTVRLDGKKIPGETAIPFGIYRVVITQSARFKKKLPELLDVPYFSGVRIHSGNTAKDSEGCILVGRNTIKGMVTQSRDTMKKLMAILEPACSKHIVTIEII